MATVNEKMTRLANGFRSRTYNISNNDLLTINEMVDIMTGQYITNPVTIHSVYSEDTARIIYADFDGTLTELRLQNANGVIIPHGLIGVSEHVNNNTDYGYKLVNGAEQLTTWQIKSRSGNYNLFYVHPNAELVFKYIAADNEPV